MYDLKPYKYILSDPWDVSVGYRISKASKMKDLGFKIVAYFYENPDSITFRYAVYNMCQCLEYSTKWRGIFFFENELTEANEFLNKIDIIVIVRYKWTSDLDIIIKKAKSKKINVIFYVDDLIYNPKYLLTVIDTLSVKFDFEQAYKEWFQLTARLFYTAQQCDAIITTNEYIGNFLKNDLNKDCYTIANFFNMEQDKASQYLVKQKTDNKTDNKFTVGYFSGTPTHQKDFEVAAHHLTDLMDEYDNIELKIVGDLKLPEYMKHLTKKNKIKRVPIMNFIDLQCEIASVDLNIVPLVNNIFTNCKSEPKYFEAGIVNTITCASPTYIYKKIINDGINGFLANDNEWGESIYNIYTNYNKINDIIHNIFNYSYKNYSYYNQAEKLETILTKLSNF